MPHPFDRFHSVPDYEHLLDIVEEIDILEVFNPRVAVTAFNEEAERFARKYRIVAGGRLRQPRRPGARQRAGADPRLRRARPSSSRRCADADITRKHKNLVYVQTLKLLQTRGGRRRRNGGCPTPSRCAAGRPRRRSEGRRASKS